MTSHRMIAPGLLGLLALGSGTEAAGPRPNIVLILADDLGWGDVSFNGRTEWTTPNLDRMGTRGIIFKRFYTAAVTCAPSRAALMTGRATIHNGVTRNDDDLPAREVTIAEALKAQGYATALFGKWHHGKARDKDGPAAYVHPMDQGFDEFFGFTDAVHALEKFPKTLWNGRAQEPVSGYSDDLFTDHAVDFLKRHQGGPFFLYIPYTSSHYNIEVPDDELARHRGKFPERDSAWPVNATYAAMVTRLDRNVGRVLAALDELGLAEKTLVLFTSDHGATFEAGNLGASNFHDSNRPFRGQKRTLWEGGIRVPAIARWPGHVPAGAVSDDVTHMTDLFPTILGAVGAEPDPAWRIDGLDLGPVWTGTATAPERTLFWEWRSEGAHQLAAMRGRFKLVITGDERPELFDIEADPAERRNVIAEHPELARDLRRALQAWLATEVAHCRRACRPLAGTAPNGQDLQLRDAIKLDEAARPHKTIDWVHFTCPNGDAAPDNLGINTFEGDDSAKICSGGPGDGRPTKCKVGDDGPQNMIVRKREKD
ncbi:MAG: sulfatase-like hydrolase/transferase [Planctomycetaceae bacterium]|nr:sulfatase-like hydrolase/transferase [Planctomycetaceae bacterium]